MASEQNYENALIQLENELRRVENEKRELVNTQMSLFGASPTDENLIKYQLDMREDLDRIYHLLKGDEIVEDKDGNIHYVSPIDDHLRPFNEFGVKLIMNVMSFYLNRNTILSNYDEDTINWKLRDFGVEVTDLIFNRYEEMFMTTTFEKEFEKLYHRDLIELPNGEMRYKEDREFKRLNDEMIIRVNFKLQEHLIGKMKMYSLIVTELTDSVHSAYLRALHGMENKNLRTARTVTQTEPIGRYSSVPMVSQRKQFRLMHPSTWFGG